MKVSPNSAPTRSTAVELVSGTDVRVSPILPTFTIIADRPTSRPFASLAIRANPYSPGDDSGKAAPPR